MPQISHILGDNDPLHHHPEMIDLPCSHPFPLSSIIKSIGEETYLLRLTCFVCKFWTIGQDLRNTVLRKISNLNDQFSAQCMTCTLKTSWSCASSSGVEVISRLSS